MKHQAQHASRAFVAEPLQRKRSRRAAAPHTTATNMKHIDSTCSTAYSHDCHEPAGDDGFCFDLCLAPLLPAGVEPWLSTRAIFFVDGELPVSGRLALDTLNARRSPEFVSD